MQSVEILLMFDVFAIALLLVSCGIIFRTYKRHRLRASITLLTSIVLSMLWFISKIAINILSISSTIFDLIPILISSSIPIFLYIYFTMIDKRNYVIEILLIWYFTTIISNTGSIISLENLYLSSFGIMIVILVSIVFLFFVYRSWKMVKKSSKVKNKKIERSSFVFMSSFIVASITPLMVLTQSIYALPDIIHTILIIVSIVLFLLAHKIYLYVSYITPFNLRNMYIFHSNSGISIYDYSTKFSAIDPMLMTSLVIGVSSMVRSLMREELGRFETDGSVFMIAKYGMVTVMVVGDTYNTVIHDGMKSFIEKIDKYMFSEEGEKIREQMDSKSIVKAMMKSELPMFIEVIYEG